MALPFPEFDPVAVQLGPLAIRWYALAYVVGILLGWWYALRLIKGTPGRPTADDLGDFVVWAMVGIILGGRLGFVLFYDLPQYLSDPLRIVRVWEGGMSFHGGLLGVIGAILIFSRRRGLSPFALGDVIATVAPIGLLLGRIANFVNGELWGRPTDVPWGMIFPRDPEQLVRHPSQLYQAFLEGVVLLIVMAVAARRPALRERTGALSGLFLIAYAIARSIGELFRQPDLQVGYLAFGLTMGQLLCVPMALAGIWILRRAPWGRTAPSVTA